MTFHVGDRIRIMRPDFNPDLDGYTATIIEPPNRDRLMAHDRWMVRLDEQHPTTSSLTIYLDPHMMERLTTPPNSHTDWTTP